MAPDASADRLRKQIDAGRTGEKVDFPDPAAAPLGTDSEAGGSPVQIQELGTPQIHHVRPDRPTGPMYFYAFIILAILGIGMFVAFRQNGL
jgi:hypothetical protein